ncbi:MAG: crossover junction endodeoxyribonuclease RuvC [Caldimicrobium sp.]
MKILGVDPGLLNLGYTLIEVKKNKFSILKANTLKSKSKDPLQKRLYHLYANFMYILELYKPDIIALEEPIAKANPFSTAKLFQVQAIVLLVAEEIGVPIKIYHPSFWKSYLCGNGRATKKDVLYILKNVLTVDNFKIKIQDEHTCDALALAIVCALEMNLY